MDDVAFRGYSILAQGLVVHEDPEASVCGFSRHHSHWYDLCGDSVLAPRLFEIGRKPGSLVCCDNLERSLMPRMAIPAKGSGQGARAFVDRALGVNAPRKG